MNNTILNYYLIRLIKTMVYISYIYKKIFKNLSKINF